MMKLWLSSLVLASCLLVAFSQDVSIEKQVPVSPSDVLCNVDADCRLQKTMCNTFDCGSAVNATAASLIYDQLFQLCPDQVYISADANCPNTYLKCDKGQCASHVVPVVRVDQSQQVCKTDADCAVFQTDCRGAPCCTVTGTVGVSASNLAAFESEWDKLCAGVTPFDCTMVKCMQPVANNTCVSGYCTVNGAPPAIADPVPECDPATKPSAECVCLAAVSVSLDATTGQTTYSKPEWACPSLPCSCDGLPLPVLDPAVDGCSTSEAKFYCVSSISGSTGGSTDPSTGVSGSSSGSTGTAVKRQVVTDPAKPEPCAHWEHSCGKPAGVQCAFDFMGCGMNPCLDVNAPRPMLACITLFDPVRACEDACLSKHGACMPQLTENTWECVTVKATPDYDACVASCKSDVPPVDKCTWLGDKCNCEANGCGWCESAIALDQPVTVSTDGAASASISYGYCASLESSLQCTSGDRTFTTDPVVVAASTTAGSSSTDAEASKPACEVVIPIDPVEVPPNPPVDTIDLCLVDQRCVAPLDLNKELVRTASAAEAPEVAKRFTVVVTAIIKSDSGVVNLAVDVAGDREPSSTESAEVCGLIVNTIASHIGFDKNRVESCTLSKVTKAAVKRQTSVSNSYVANIRINNQVSSVQNGASSALVSFAALALLALLLLF